MEKLLEMIKLIIYLGLMVAVSKYLLVTSLRKLAENLKLKPKTVGEIAGYATSMPELLTVSISSLSGLMGATIYNVLSSNIINMIQYIIAIFINKNQKMLKNPAIKVDLLLVVITIVLPLVLILLKIELNLMLIPAFLILYIVFRIIVSKVHRKYLQQEEQSIETEIEIEEREEKGDRKKTIKHIFFLLVSGILLFLIGNQLGDTLEILCNIFQVPQFVIGMILGFATSIPELMTFFESQTHHKKKENQLLGVVEATNNLITSNVINLFIIQTVGILIFLLI